MVLKKLLNFLKNEKNIDLLEKNEKNIDLLEKNEKNIDLLEKNEKNIDLFSYASKSGYFDYQWYMKYYNRSFSSPQKAFRHYLDVGRFSPVNPSPQFDSVNYLKNNLDVYHSQINPLQHYLEFGKNENRVFQLEERVIPDNNLNVKSTLSQSALNLKFAFFVHIFYEDYIDCFSKILENFPIKTDVFISVVNEKLKEKAFKVFEKNSNINLKEIKLCPNKGRNFGPLFVEFSDKISKYDLFCHLHSKKSLYSGREQFQWSNYLLEYLAKDQQIIIKLLNAFSEKEDIGIYYPTSFWMMPSWVNHMLSNSGSIQFWEKKFGLEINDEFFAYPVGGMFWARPKAIQQVLDANLKYEDMPPEPLPNDGSILHALERAISFLVEKNNYKQLFYYPYSNNLSFDKKYIFESYNKSLNASLNYCLKFDYISFDLFDTLVSRKYTSSEYAKLKLGKEIVSLGFVNDPNTFIKIRNESEQELRKEKKFKGDVKIDEIYKRIAKKLDLSNEYLHMFLKREFELDLDMIEPNYKIIEFFQNAIKLGKKIFIISDTYYSLNQIKMILEKVGIINECNILLSSETGLRKDNGTMWNYVKNDLCLHKKNYLHIGDNVVSDAQLPGDFGLQTFHILHPLDKWKSLGFPTVMKKNEIDEYKILKWGKLINKANNF